MAEHLYIRLGSHVDDEIPWLIWSSSEQEIIASGELSGVAQLDSLREKAQARQVTVLVSSAEVCFKQLQVPAKSKKAMQLAAPYMVEDDLAQDVEELFFAYGEVKHHSGQENCFIAVVERAQMQLWQTWLSDAGIVAKRLVPDVLALPNADQHWQAVQLQRQILVRQGPWQGVVVDETLWPAVAQKWSETAELTIDSYSALPDAPVELAIEAQPEELPLALLAQHAGQQSFNLLQGEFQPKVERSPLLKNWGWAAGFVVAALLLNVVLKSVSLMQLNQQQAQVEQQIIQEYKRAFPNTKRVRVSTIRSQLKRKMSALGEGSNEGQFLLLLSKVQPAFEQVPSLKPDSIRFDGKRNELRLQASANDYQQFEQFKVLLEAQQLVVSQGAQNNQGDKVSGSLSITLMKGGRS